MVELNDLSDHDLLIRIATQMDGLPARVRQLEIELAHLKTWGPVIVALITAAGVILSAVLR